METDIQARVVALLDPSRRMRAARELARAVGAEELMVFVPDVEVGAPIPAPGFPQTLSDGRAWRDFLSACAPERETRGELRHPLCEQAMPAVGIASAEGSIVVLIGGEPRSAEQRELLRQLPLLGAALQGEQALCMASGRTKVADEAVQKAAMLTQRLDTTRRELQRALAKAEEVTRAKDDFLAVISHELRSPLSAILSWSHILQQDNVDEAMRRRGAESIERNARTQAKLIEDILDYSRIASGRLRLDVVPVDLARIIEAALDVVRPRANEKNIVIENAHDGEAVQVRADPDRLQQVLTNLLSNAVTYTESGGRVMVEMEFANDGIEIRVRDTGVGIEPNFLPHLFEAFRQADGGTTRRHGGLGLGLSIARRLVELHGGSIEAQSAGKYRGATFIVRLPPQLSQFQNAGGVDAALADDASRATDAGIPSLTGLHVLILDDDEDTRVAIASVVERYGAACRSAASVDEALDVLNTGRCDCIISDISMPHEDGYSFVRRLRADSDPAKARIPAIAMTAHARASDRLAALTAGYAMHLAKPVEAAALVRAIADVTRGNGARDPSVSWS